jgi:hypothetical protein
MAELRYAVVSILNGIKNPHTGLISNHRSEEAARKAIEKANRQLRKRRGYETAWQLWAILDRHTGEKR